jgi:hypothetical protein
VLLSHLKCGRSQQIDECLNTGLLSQKEKYVAARKGAHLPVPDSTLHGLGQMRGSTLVFFPLQAHRRSSDRHPRLAGSPMVEVHPPDAQ